MSSKEDREEKKRKLCLLHVINLTAYGKLLAQTVDIIAIDRHITSTEKKIKKLEDELEERTVA